jgi:hypothetical protein
MRTGEFRLVGKLGGLREDRNPMVVLVRLTAEEVEIIEKGFIDDPSLRCWGDGVEDYEEDDEEYDDEDDHDGTAESGRPFDLSLVSLERKVAAVHWGGSTVTLGLLVASRMPSGGDVSRLRMDIIALARAETRGRVIDRRMGLRSLRLTGLHRLDQCVDLQDLIRPLPKFACAKIKEVLNYRIRPLPRGTNNALIDALRNNIVDFDQVARNLTRIQRSPRRKVPERGSWLERRDAAMTALRIFDREWRNLQPVVDPPSPPGRVDEMIARATENDLINDDIEPFRL